MQPKKILFVLLLILSATPFVSAPLGLALGIIYGLVFENPWPKESSKFSKKLLQWSVIGLGFGVSIGKVWTTGKDAFLYTIVTISLTLLIGYFLGKLFKTLPNITWLISFGTAICGGSAIAAMAPVIKAKTEEVGVAIATVFTLNSVALLLFPYLGHVLNLSQETFGLWSALAIHDTSSVVGAGAAYGATALAIGTTVKLTRAIWIAPVSMLFAFFQKSDAKVKFPTFILGFIAAAIIVSLFPQFSSLWHIITVIAKQSLIVTLFLIGSGITVKTLQQVGFAPLLLGITLWVIVSVSTLLAINYGLIK